MSMSWPTYHLVMSVVCGTSLAVIIARLARMRIRDGQPAYRRCGMPGRRRYQRVPGLPDDGQGCVTPAMADRWYDLAARYDEQTAAEPVYPRRAKE